MDAILSDAPCCGGSIAGDSISSRRSSRLTRRAGASLPFPLTALPLTAAIEGQSRFRRSRDVAAHVGGSSRRRGPAPRLMSRTHRKRWRRGRTGHALRRRRLVDGAHQGQEQGQGLGPADRQTLLSSHVPCCRGAQTGVDHARVVKRRNVLRLPSGGSFGRHRATRAWQARDPLGAYR